MRQEMLRRGAFLLLSIGSLHAADVKLNGRVVDVNEAPVRDARVTLHQAQQSWRAVTDSSGVFHFTVSPGDFTITLEREGYYPIKDRPLHIEASIESSQEITLTIAPVSEVFQSVDVAATPSPVDITQSDNIERLTGTEVNDTPYANSHSLRNSMMLLPGVIEDAGGGLHVNGSQENQVLYLLNGFDIADPVSGQFKTALAVEGIRSVDLSTGRFSPEYGNGSAGVLAINTENGTDAFHYTATDFIPGLSIQQGLHLGNWYPRVGFSGPIIPGRAWFSDTFDSEYSEAVIRGLPRGENIRSGWAGANLLHTQFNLTRSNILFADFLANVDHEGRVELAPLNPISTTLSLRTNEFLGSVKDQIYLGRGVLLELGYAHNQFATVQVPQGSELYVISPTGQSGNNFVNATQDSSRDEGLVHIYFPQARWLGTHQIETGANVDFRRYRGDFNRTGYDVLGLSGQLLSQTLFPNPAMFYVTDTSSAAYVRDTWRLSKQFQFDLGILEAWDARARGVAWSPRAGFSWSPFGSTRTRISAGYAITHDEITLDALSRPLDQVAVTTQYNPDGTIAGAPTAATFSINNALMLPRATNWTINADREIAKNVYIGAKYLRRRGTDGFAFINTLDLNAPPSLLPLPGGGAGGNYQLENIRRDDYDSFQISARQRFSGQHEWTASYTHSRSISNALIDPNSAQPLQILSGFVPVPWNAPNRFLGEAYLALPGKRGKNWAVSTLVDLRSGFPFSVRDPTGVVIGAVDASRFPLNFDLDLALERIVTLRGYRFALRGGVNNITNSLNPTGVNNVTGSPQFGQFLGGEGRHFVVRVRFFGHAKGL